MTSILFKRTQSISETTIDDEVVVMDLANGDFFSLTGTALEMWNLIDGTRDNAAIIAELVAKFAVAPDEIVGDVTEFIDQALAAGLLEYR
ncbi:PqqD family protein [Novosphingobium sp.]|uniref:PqqD family protein n=1 Tax=Novosphingobium sp. TaxID=1874826 RepID=UPI002736EC0D|nr:PqqD family protein [Novosphingobium sp.]MDP3907596.1 PqqD family protein [Novosphingobium sp.]